MRLKHWLILWIIPFYAVPVMAEEKNISLTASDWPPYTGKKLENYGLSSEIVSESFKRAGYKVEIKFMPWKRALSQVKKGRFDAAFPAYYSEERAEKYVISNPIINGPLGFYKRKDTQISYKDLQDLKPYRIGVMLGYVNTPEFDAADFLQKITVKNDKQLLKQLFRKKLDIVVIDKLVAHYFLNTGFQKGRDVLEFMEPPLSLNPHHVLFSRKIKGYQQKLNDFNAELKKIIEDGIVKEIFKKHGF